MDKICKGFFTELDGDQYYKIENYDCMEDFFMTITSSSDIWNFCWAQGGVTAGRIDCDHAIFPYYTADKVSDAKSYTGSYTAIQVQTCNGVVIWEPFSSLYSSQAIRNIVDKNIVRNIYKNKTGSCVWFEEINNELELSFRYCWTSSAKFGLVRKSIITNLSDKTADIKILDGCRNILPACVTADFQNNNSVLLDAYKKTDLEEKSNLALFAVSSIVTDKAEPSEGLFANTCWFSTRDTIILNPEAPNLFANGKKIEKMSVVKGKRPAAYILKEINLQKNSSESWYQVFDTRLDSVRVTDLCSQIADRTSVTKELEKDIYECQKLMETYISESDGFQQTADLMTCSHHTQNVMFNIMRGGFFANNGKINLEDFVKFISQRNKNKIKEAETVLKQVKNKADKDGFVSYEELEQATKSCDNHQLVRLFYEYMPLTFSRRHGDPSRPWNRFNIKLRDDNGNPILNYEGNWRDIFQNWEALAWSYPQYIKNMTAKFLNAMTIEGFNPYHISREGINWEVPDPNNPWAQIGFWGDHQVIYLEKLLEFYSDSNRDELLSSLDAKIYASSNVPYRIKSYKDILENPRSTILFDRELDSKLQEKSKAYGSDAKLVCDKNENVALVTLTAKLLQIVIAKTANFVPGGGIWLNTQRPEWNDANNALAGYGLSMVTLCYLHRFISFLIKMYNDSKIQQFELPSPIANCFKSLGNLYRTTLPEASIKNNKTRREFTDAEGKFFEIERDALYEKGYANGTEIISRLEIINNLEAINIHIKNTIRINKRDDGLYHSYNTVKISDDEMKIEHLDEMLEGQVAVLSAQLLLPEEALDVIKALKNSKIYEARQNSYMLYPDKELKNFIDKNCISKEDASNLASLIEKTGTKILAADKKGTFHFNSEFRNSRFMEDYCATLSEKEKPTTEEMKMLNALYEKTFNHHSFTGRSGTFFAYEGLGSIYWHMVSKLLLAIQENVFRAIKFNSDPKIVSALIDSYYDVRSGIGFNKTPSLYGAFPADPYSHTPSGQGAKQPGMTGQVKEEVLTRWGELGVNIESGIAYFEPKILRDSEFKDDGTLSFTWCNTPVIYHKAQKEEISVNGSKRGGNSLTAEETKKLFSRNGEIQKIEAWVKL